MNLQPEFIARHIGPQSQEIADLTQAVDTADSATLVAETIPESIRLKKPIEITAFQSEHKILEHLKKIAAQNTLAKDFIGVGYYPSITPNVILRNVFENPNWYTAYTAYQAEISQGRLEALINFQTVCSDLTGMEIANASLLDEGTAAAEAMTFMHRIRNKDKKSAMTFHVSKYCFPQTIAIIETRAEPLGIKLEIADPTEFNFSEDSFGSLFQYPDCNGLVRDYTQIVNKAKTFGCKIGVAADLLSLTLLTPPGEWGADVVVGSTQRFGIPIGFGGPHAAYFTTKSEYQRQVPGRIIGESKDKFGRKTYRMALQTREQHIRRDKATSNICTSQVLLANMAGFYAVYHGPEGLKNIATRIHNLTSDLYKGLSQLGLQPENASYFDTLTIQLSSEELSKLKPLANDKLVNFFYVQNKVRISLNELTESQDIDLILSLFKEVASDKSIDNILENGIPKTLKRESRYLQHARFSSCHTETAMMRYLRQLELKDFTLTTCMIPLGSCTMKLNAAVQLIPLSWPEFANIHPFAPTTQTQGYLNLLNELNKDLCTLTGFDALSLQPNSGAQGEYAGLLAIRAYLQSKGEGHRDVILIPQSAHGTNFATTTLVGMEVVLIKCDEYGNIDLEDLKSKAEKHQNSLAALMVTYPSTHGVFESSIKEVCDIIHQQGGQVYMDGANLNAQVGHTNPSEIGADVCHINLHKTFAIPHGGGGPGMGPIGVKAHLAPYLPKHPISDPNNNSGISPVSAAHWGSALINIISYTYIKLLGSEGIKQSTTMAILNANYIKERLKKDYKILYTGPNGRVAHELIIDLRSCKKEYGVDCTDIAKRLMDYGFHAPTVAFPVPGSMMIEPTESENKIELDRFCDAMSAIKQELDQINSGTFTKEDNPIINSPHTEYELCQTEWTHCYSREVAAFPTAYLQENKVWPKSARIDQAYGDRNLFCACS